MRTNRNAKINWMLAAAVSSALAGSVQAATVTWIGGGADDKWSTLGNWDIGVPVARDVLVFDGSTRLTPDNDLLAGTRFDNLTFAAGAGSFTLGGNGISLGGGITGFTNSFSGVNNLSPNLQTVNMPIHFLNGHHTVGGGDGGLVLTTFTREPYATVNFTPGTGGITTTPASAPLVNGILGAWATVGGDWATRDASNKIVAYTGYTPVAAGGAITSNPASNVNIDTAGGAVTMASPGVTDINTLRFPVNGATQTVDVGTGNTLRLGANGGIFRSGNTNNQLVIGASTAAGGTLTAGGADNTPGTILFNVISNNDNQGGMGINSLVTDNGNGAVTVVKTGLGPIQMNNANTYTGGTVIVDGRFQTQNALAFGPGKVTVLGRGQAFLTGANIPNNFDIVGQGTAEAGGHGAIRLGTNTNVQGLVTLIGDARITFRGNFTNQGTVSGRITGPHNLQLGGYTNDAAGTLILSNTNNDWTGNTFIAQSQRVRLGANNVIPHGAGKGDLIFDSSTDLDRWVMLDLFGFNETVNGLGRIGANPSHAVIMNTGAAASTLTVGDNNASSTFDGVIQEAPPAATYAGTGRTLSLTKIGTGVFTLGGPDNTVQSTYTGQTTVQNGILRAGSDIAFSPNSAIVLGAGATSGALDVNGLNPVIPASISTAGTGTGNVIGNSAASPGAIKSTGTSTVSAVIQDVVGGGTSTTGVIVGGGTLTLSAANTYTGATTIGTPEQTSPSTLLLTGSLGATPVTINTGGTLVANGSQASAGSVTVGAGGVLTGTGNGATTGKLGAVTLQTDGSIRPGASGADGGVGTLGMSSLTVSGGDMRVDLAEGNVSDTILVSGAANYAGPSTISPTVPRPGTYTLLTAADLSGTAPTLSTPANTRATFDLRFDSGDNNKIELTIIGSPKSLTWTGAQSGVWDVGPAGTPNWTDGTTPERFFNLDSVTFDNTGANRVITLDTNVRPGAVVVNNDLAHEYTISGTGGIGDGAFVGGTNITKSGVGRLNLGGTNTHTGVTAVQEGTLATVSGTALSPGSAVILGNGTTSGVLDLAGNSNTAGGLGTSGTGTGNRVTNSGGSSATLTIAGGNNTFGGIIENGPGGVALTVAGGTLNLTGPNTYTGATTITPTGTLRVGDGGTTGSIASTSITNDGTLAFNRSDNVTLTTSIGGNGVFRKEGAGTLVNTLDGTASSVVVTGGTLQLGTGATTGSFGDAVPVSTSASAVIAFNRNDDTTHSGVISGAGGVTKMGTGTLTLSGNNTYSGPTNIQSGKILATNNNSLGAIPGGVVTVAAGAAFDISGNLTLNNANFGAKEFRIAGNGVDGGGALTNTGPNQQNAFQRVRLTADASVGGTGRMDIRGGTPQLNLDGFTLTKNGTNQFSLVGVAVNDGNIVVNNGIFAIETTTTILDTPADTTITLNSPATGTTNVQFFNTTGNTTITRPMVVNGNAVQIGNNSAAAQPSTFSSPILLNGNLTFFTPNAGTLTANGVISETGGPRTVTKVGANTVVLGGQNTYTGPTNVEAGTLRVTGSVAESSAVNVTTAATFEAGSTQTVKALNLANGASAVITSGGNKVLITPALNIDGVTDNWGAKVDVTNNDMVLRSTPANRTADYARTLNQLKSGLNEAAGVFWTGNGITSSTAAATGTPPGTLTAVGAILNDFAQAGLPPGPIYNDFSGVPVGTEDILLKYTWFGDADLSGVVDGTDYFLIDQAFAAGTLNGGWLNGDFNYDGKVDGTDYFLIDQAFSAQTGPLSGGPLASASAVPEPSVLGVVLAAAGLLVRRRRRA